MMCQYHSELYWYNHQFHRCCKKETKYLAKYSKPANNIIRENTFRKELYLCGSQATTMTQLQYWARIPQLS